MFHHSLASKRRQQTLPKEAVGDNINAEMVPFNFPAGGGGDEIQENPFVYVLMFFNVKTLNA